MTSPSPNKIVCSDFNRGPDTRFSQPNSRHNLLKDGQRVKWALIALASNEDPDQPAHYTGSESTLPVLTVMEYCSINDHRSFRAF